MAGRQPSASLIDQAPNERTLFGACILALGENAVRRKLLLGPFPHRSVDDRLMLTRMTELLVPNLSYIKRIREERT